MIWLTAPKDTQAANAGFGAGSEYPPIACTPSSHRIAKGSPYRNRTSVAPSVPSSAVRLRCAALRSVWANAAQTVTGIQSQSGAIMRRPGP